MESLLSSSEAVFAEDASPLDKKTLTATHFETVWRVFGFSPPHLPAEVGRYGAVLRDLRQHRNNIAHGHQSFDELAAVKSISDAKHMLNMVQDIGAHLEGETSTYISEGRYLR
jgi:hypothetical protein